VETPAGEAIAAEPDLDENGVDLAQIRAMLALSPLERLERVSAFMSSLTALREPDGDRVAR
jgi:hypothetical protein